MSSGPAHRFSRHDYTIACICPMGVELAPVEAMLDKIHDPLPPIRSQNVYTFGRIGEHDIVVAMMSETGNNAAARTATQLMNDFPSIRVGFLVGIGGGVPSDIDLRLGDVVVSQETGTYGGVIQFDLGKRLANGTFERTGYLNKPPPVLNASVRKLQARHCRQGNKLSELVQEMLQRNPGMREQYMYPAEFPDYLFASDSLHLPSSGAPCDQCNHNQLVTRPSRSDHEPHIHYGTVGSANVLVKDAVTRDALQNQYGILCIEMEAAGAMPAFPCIVIRGICDYADSHKNKRWQPYAAAVAAAYMKELLLTMPRQTVAHMEYAEDVVRRKCENIEELLTWNAPPAWPENFEQIIAKRIHGMTEQSAGEYHNQKAQLASINTELFTDTQSTASIDQTATQMLANMESILQITSAAQQNAPTGTHQLHSGFVNTAQTLSPDCVKLAAHIDSLARAVTTLVRNSNTDELHKEHRHLTQAYAHMAATYEEDIRRDTRSERKTTCPCRFSNNTHRWQPLSLLLLTKTFKTNHFSFCPFYEASDQSLELTLQLVPPAWLLSHTIGFGIGLNNWWIRKLFFLPKIVVDTHRLVDSTISPAFCAIKFAREELYNDGLHQIVVPTLQRNLQYLFQESRASPHDVDFKGRTLLNEVLWIYISHHPRETQPGEEYVSLVKFLLEKGADPNVSSLSAAEEASDRWDDVGGTSLDQFAKRLRQNNAAACWNVPTATQFCSMTILKALIDAKAEFSKPFNTLDTIHPSYQARVFLGQVEEFIAFEQQIEICELGALIPIILQRNLSQFRKTVNGASLSVLDYCSPRNGLRPVHFAVFWPAALKILIARGVDVNVADNHSRRPIHLAIALKLPDAVECLLEADCALFTPHHRPSLLQQCLMTTPEWSPLKTSSEEQRMLDMVVKAVIDRHTRLLNAAKEHLPGSRFSKLSIMEGHISEGSAPRIIEMLSSHGINVPEALVLDGKSVYDFADFHGDTILTPDTATTFWNAGFRDIDVPSEQGATPYLQSWYCANFEMVRWFVNKGIALTSTHRDSLLTALHFYAERINYPGAFFAHDITNLHADKEIMARINEELGVPHDECTCPCSPNGCSPVKFLSDIVDESTSRKDKFRKWLEEVQPKQSLVDQYILEFTRCLLFEFLGGKHSCCRIGQTCEVEKPGRWNTRRISDKIPDTPGKQLSDRWTRRIEHFTYCVDDVPIPTAHPMDYPGKAEAILQVLNSCMSRYDEMPQREIMDPDEQPFKYVKWAVLEHHLDVDVTFHCNLCRRDIPR